MLTGFRGPKNASKYGFSGIAAGSEARPHCIERVSLNGDGIFCLLFVALPSTLT